MTGPSGLFDADAVRARTSATVFELSVPAATVVLGARQSRSLVEEDALARDGVGLRRRQGGGGAVLLRPGDCWLELWLPAGVGPTGPDVRATACRVGEWWSVALRGVGVTSEVHRDGVVRAEEGAIACFAGVGPGELTVNGRKLLGLSQWRVKQGVLVSCVVPAARPSDLLAYLSSPDGAPALRDATSLAEALPNSDGSSLAARVSAVVSDALGGLEVADSAPGG